MASYRCENLSPPTTIISIVALDSAIQPVCFMGWNAVQKLMIKEPWRDPKKNDLFNKEFRGIKYQHIRYVKHTCSFWDVERGPLWNAPVTGGPSQRASNAEIVSISWRHLVLEMLQFLIEFKWELNHRLDRHSLCNICLTLNRFYMFLTGVKCVYKCVHPAANVVLIMYFT